MKLVLLKAGLTLMIICAFSLLMSAQQQKTDSLQVLINNGSGIDKYEALVALTRAYAVTDDSKALETAKEARIIALQLRDSSRIVTSSRMVAQLLNRLDRGKDAEGILLEVIRVAKRNDFRDEYKSILNHLAIANTVQAKYDKALDYNFQTLILREQDKDIDQLNVSLNNIGLVYFKLENYHKALEYYSKSLKLLENADNKYFLDRLLVNIGLCYNQLEDYDKAQKFFDRGFEVCRENCSEQTKIEGQFGLGALHYNRSNFPEAIGHFTESYSIAKKIGNKRFEAENLIFLARIYVRQNDNDQAIEVLQKCEKISLSSGYSEILIETYEEFSKIFIKLNNFKNASYYQSLYINLNDSVHSEKMTMNLMKIEAEYLERENKARIASQDQILALKMEIIERQQLLNIFIGSMAVMLILLAAILFRTNRQKHAINRVLDEKVKERTKALEESHRNLIRLSNERQVLIQRTSQDINGSLSIIRGQCLLGLQDISDPDARQYISKMNLTSEQLEFTLKNLESVS